MSLNAKNPSWARPLPQRLRSVVVAAGLQLVAMSAFAISGSGTFTITSPSSVPSGSVTETVSGAYTTPLGDTGSFTLTRDSSTGYITAAGGSPTGPSFETGANGITARNSVCESVKHSTLTYCKDSPDKFVYTLTLSPAPNSGPLTIEVVQGSSPVGNSEVATIQFEYAPGASGVLAANPAVKLHSQNPSNVADTSTPQIRTFDSNTPTLDKASPLPGANTALSAPTSIFSGDKVQSLAAYNASTNVSGTTYDGSRYRFDFVNATTVRVTYTGNMKGDSNLTTRVGETFNEWIGFGVRSGPVAKDDLYRVPTSGATTASVLGNDTMGGAPATGTNSTVTPTGTPPTGLTLNADGTITIAANTAPGTYTIPYKVCSKLATTPESCATATATVVVEGAIPANDSYGPIPSAAGATTASVLANDKVNLGDGKGDVAAVLGANGNATLTPGTSPVTGLTMNSDGTITVAANTAPGTYSYPYTLCAVPATTPPPVQPPQRRSSSPPRPRPSTTRHRPCRRRPAAPRRRCWPMTR
ncbi:hypothetical protein [Ottowia sp. SB7-C50]|uniref:hypothetical protein n=1 Tax=Ottowia sp. SB7-C50 TaxID=3081231 RepID=UPI002953DADD|nr:hypothetical protein [Ottowia sp. SB7-C50]WOP14069.1 hypothetical protein R0D99_09135 [Ottowia sp. SB7-C50]